MKLINKLMEAAGVPGGTTITQGEAQRILGVVEALERIACTLERGTWPEYLLEALESLH